MDRKPLNEIIKDAAELKGLSPQRLHQLTEIPEGYLEAILKGNLKQLPAQPYARGYLLKLAQILDLDGHDLWRRYQEESEIKTSGALDRLPENRFAIKPVNKKAVVGGAIIAAAILYLALSAPRLMGRPELTIYSPNSETSLSNSPFFTFLGKTDPQDILKINDKEVLVDKNGYFNKSYNLQAGLNSFEFTVKRLLGKKIKVVKQVIYQP